MRERYLTPAHRGPAGLFLHTLALGNILIIGFVTIAQTDLKLMIGYSSVMHMGYVFLGIATLSVVGVGGAVMLMFAHGLSVALMFMLATAVFNRTGTYDMKAIGGLGPNAPVLAGLFVAASMASIGLPGFANFWGEFTVFIAQAAHPAAGDLWPVGPVGGHRHRFSMCTFATASTGCSKS